MPSQTLTKSLLRTTDNYIKALEKAGYTTVDDLINHFPREYEDRTEVLDNFSLINIKEKNTILVTLTSINTSKTANNKLLTKAIFEDINGFLSEGVWFNRKYLASQLQAFTGKKIILSGKVKYAFGKVTFQSPEAQTDLSKMGGEIVPIYPEINYIPSKWILGKMEILSPHLTSPKGRGIEGILPEHIIKKYDFISRQEALYKIHFPKNSHDIEEAKRRLGYEELYEINHRAISSKYEKFEHSTGKSIAINLNAEYVKEILSKLPFELTNHQKIALFQVLKDMEKTHSMQRLLEGDVGTGKTVVAFVAMVHAWGEWRASEKKILTSLIKTSNCTQVSPHLTSPNGRGIEREPIMYSQKEYTQEYITELSRELRKQCTDAEAILWEVLRNKKLYDLKFRRQHPIGRYIADFYCHELELVIELDGGVHDSKDQKEYDDARTELINNSGIELLRFSNEDVYSNLNKIFEGIIPYLPLPLGEARGGLTMENTKDCASSLQIALMAPTAILATQHFLGMQTMLFEYGMSCELLVGATTAKRKKEIKQKLATGNIDVIIGTHALVQEDVLFSNLGLVIIDEQHRFGVKQREVLEAGLGNKSGIIPHSLNMTATPIPRTLALTLYGDQDLSVINEYPKGRKEIYTKVLSSEEARYQAQVFIRNELEKGRQVFWVSPLVEESEKMDLANAIAVYDNLIDMFSPFQVGLIHGKMKPKEKDQIMLNFKEKKIDILSATSVIEVGIDIPNASIICIEGAERFGLSQLHQIRGRVGRGEYQSYCYLFPTKGQKTDRLKAMERSNNGFELSEIDLELRGPGEVYGLRQSGVPDLKIASLTDLELVSQIREDIEEMFEKK